MSEPDDDRDLEAFLARRSPIADAWRDARRDDAAPAALDAPVLGAATEAVATPAVRPPQRGPRRWRLPIGLAASLLVGLGVLREIERDPLARQALVVGPTASSAADATVAADEALRAEVLSKRAQAAAKPSAAASARLSLDEQEGRARQQRRHEVEQRSARRPARSEIAPPPVASAAAATPDAEKADARSGAALPERAEPRLPAPAAVEAAPSFAEPAPALALGRSTPEAARARFGEPLQVVEDLAGETTLLLFGRAVDPRGELQLRFAGPERRLVEILLQLDPPVPLADLRRDEGLADSAGCVDGLREPLEDRSAGALRWPSRGIVLMLDGEARVVAIRRQAGCR